MTGRIGVFGCKHTTRDLIQGLLSAGLEVAHCLTLSPQKGSEQKVAGYYDLRPYLEEVRIPYTTVHKYSLKSQKDEEVIGGLGLDVALCMGWQRLIPDWCLNIIPRGVYGMHGSNKPLPHGRGRSPLNWSLIQNKDIFFTHLFRYDPGVDDGPVVAVQKFDITPWDNCHTLHLKNMLAMIKLCERHLPGIIRGESRPIAQPDIEPSYYPKRTAEDGLIYWEDATLDIYNLIRAVTKPFPGAYTYIGQNTPRVLKIWHAIPFDSRLEWEGAVPGQILEVFYDGSFVVKTGDTTVLVDDYEGEPLKLSNRGELLHGQGLPRKEWPNLPR